MSIRLNVILACAVYLGHPPILGLAQTPPAQPVTQPTTPQQPAAPTANTTAPATAVPYEVAPPAAPEEHSGMVFDPTTGRYMPVAEQLPWRNSFFIFDNSVSHTTFDNSTLSNTSYWIQTYSFRPRWNFTDTLSLRVRQDLFAEWVASTTSAESQPVVFDTQLDLIEASVATVEGVIIGVGGRVLLPVSLASRNANRVIATGAVASATKVFADVLAGFVTQASIGYQHWWATSTTSTSYELNGTPGALCVSDNDLFPCSRFATPTSVRDIITAGLFGQVSFTPEFSAGLAFSWWWQRGAGLDTVDLGALGPGVNGELSDRSATHWRNLTVSSVFLAYQVNSWLQASLGMNTLSSQLNPNGSLRNPFWNPDTQYSLTAVITIDQLYTTIRDAGTTEQAPDHATRTRSRM